MMRKARRKRKTGWAETEPKRFMRASLRTSFLLAVEDMPAHARKNLEVERDGCKSFLSSSRSENGREGKFRVGMAEARTDSTRLNRSQAVKQNTDNLELVGR